MDKQQTKSDIQTTIYIDMHEIIYIYIHTYIYVFEIPARKRMKGAPDKTPTAHLCPYIYIYMIYMLYIYIYIYRYDSYTITKNNK